VKTHRLWMCRHSARATRYWKSRLEACTTKAFGRDRRISHTLFRAITYLTHTAKAPILALKPVASVMPIPAGSLVSGRL
jgi:hypothetical protein